MDRLLAGQRNDFGFKTLRLEKRHPTEAPLISVLVRVKNEARALGAFLRSLEQQSIFPRMEVIFLDSGSTDGTCEMLQSFPASVYAIAPSEFSFGPTCNLVCSLATAPILCLASGHIEFVAPEALAEGVALLRNAPRLAAAYYRQIPNEALGASSYERAQLRWSFPPGPAPRRASHGKHAFSNAASLFRADVWRQMPFPAVNGSEDFLWAEQLLEKGGELWYLPNLCVRHSHDEQPGDLHRRVLINVEARPQNLRSWKNVAKYMIGVAGACMLCGAGPLEALRYAHAHASAYMPRKGSR